MKSLRYCEALFADHLGGHGLLENDSKWLQFRTLRCASWWDGNTALIGDSAHTAHFSVGSGTKMAMEDAVALVAALDRHPGDVDTALAEYAAVRQPQVAKIQDSAGPSLAWWEHFGRTYDALPPWQFAYHFFTRALTDRKLRRRDEAFVAAAHEHWRTGHGAEPLGTPLVIGAHRLAGRVVTVEDGGIRLPDAVLPLRAGPPGGTDWALLVDAPDAEIGLPAAVDAVAAGVAAGAALVAVRGGSPVTRRLLCEEARLGLGAVTLSVEDAPLDEDAATTAVLSGRTDLVGTAAVPA